MFEELLAEPDLLDCLLEAHVLKEDARRLSDQRLVEHVVDLAGIVETSKETDLAISRYFNMGILGEQDRSTLENCYVLTKNCLCWVEGKTTEEVGVFHTYLKTN